MSQDSRAVGPTEGISRRRFVGSLAGAAITLASAARAQAQLDDDTVGRLLGRRILDRGVTRQQTWDFAHARVATMPKVASIAEWERHVHRIRQELFDKVIFVGEAAKWRDMPGHVVWSDTIEEDGYRIRKVRYEVLPGYWMPGLLYEPHNLKGRVPLIYNTHGHTGSGGGKAKESVQIRNINLVKRGMLVLTTDWPDIGQLHIRGRHYRMSQLDLCGTSGLAPFYLTLSRALDLMMDHPHVDPKRICVNGVSGGGWQTIYISALDDRVTLCNPVAGHGSLLAEHSRDNEQSPNDMATIADYTHMTAMVAPRPMLLTYNDKDNCCYQTWETLPPLVEAAEPIYKLYGKSHHLRTHNNMVVDPESSGHNFGRENREALYRLIGYFFYPNDPHFAREDLPGLEKEIKPIPKLDVDLPENNHGFNSMARKLMRDLPREPRIPTGEAAVQTWQHRRRAKLRDIVRYTAYSVKAEPIREHQESGLHSRDWLLDMGEWAVPAVELTPTDAVGTSVVMSDSNRARASEQVTQLLQQKQRVIAFDPYYFGESALGERDHLMALLVSCVGGRPLGIQASQAAAVCRWARERHGHAVQLRAVGERVSLMALIAAAIETQAITALDLHGAMRSLKQIIERDIPSNHRPEIFCFGLLQWFDMPQLDALVAPRPLVRHR